MTLLLVLFLLLLLLLSSHAEANKSAPLSSIDYSKMSRQLADIVAIMDMDGYTINKKFLCKELGFLKVGDAVAQSFTFDIGIRWSDLSPKDQRSSTYVQNHIHKLPFDVPVGGEALPITSLEAIVRDLYQSVKRSSNSAIAYKGGHYEKDLLTSLGIPAINLESFGCPKVDMLIPKLIWLETCGKHLTSDAYHHCPKVEVEAFGEWLENHM